MASKRTVRGSGKRRQVTSARQVLSRAQAEAAQLLKLKKPRKGKTVADLFQREEAELTALLKRIQAGNITRMELHRGLKELDTGLQEVETRLRRMLNHVLYML
jgi:hypothetical protein